MFATVTTANYGKTEESSSVCLEVTGVDNKQTKITDVVTSAL